MSVVWVLSAQAASRVTVQSPSAAEQQEPSGGCGHGFGAQRPSGIQVPVPVQLASFVTVHVPAGTQQAPGGEHGFGAQGSSAVHTLRLSAVGQFLA
jgi:hypothetical protein